VGERREKRERREDRREKKKKGDRERERKKKIEREEERERSEKKKIAKRKGDSSVNFMLGFPTYNKSRLISRYGHPRFFFFFFVVCRYLQRGERNQARPD